MKFTEAEQQVLLVLKQISQDYKVAGPETIELFTDYYFGNALLNWSEAIRHLIEQKLIKGKKSIYSLTKIGDTHASALLRNLAFSNSLLRCEKSNTYAALCERVYGKNLCQHNMMDMAQLTAFLDMLKLTKNNEVLELGCGIGTITEYISDLTHARITGIDFASRAIKRAAERTQKKKHRLSFHDLNLNELTFPEHSFDTIIAIDTLYFVKDLDALIEKMSAILKPGGQMGLFYTQMTQSSEAKEILHPDKTKLASCLKKSNLDYTYRDFTENEKEIWRKMKNNAEQLLDKFESEGNYEIYRSRMQEAEYILKFVESDQISRFLYHVS